jgi:RNA polymerase sigma-70 factor, ECF subfamily
MEMCMDISVRNNLHHFFAQSSSVDLENEGTMDPMTPDRSHVRRANDSDAVDPHWETASIAQMGQGNPEGFNRLVEHYSAPIYSHLYRMTLSREEAEDLTQETFIRAYRNIGSYDPARPFRNWLYTIATNVGRNALRSRGRRIPSARLDQGTEVSVADERGSGVIEGRDRKGWLLSAVDRLPDPMPTLIQLHYQEGLSIRESAEILGMSENAAKVALHRARKKLRILLEKDKS